MSSDVNPIMFFFILFIFKRMNYEGEAFGENGALIVDPQVAINTDAILVNTEAIQTNTASGAANADVILVNTDTIQTNINNINTNAVAISVAQQQLSKGLGFCGIFATNPNTYQTGLTLLNDNRSEFFATGYYGPGLDASSLVNGNFSFIYAQSTQTPYGFRWTKPAGASSVVLSWRTLTCFEGLAATDINIGMRIDRLDGAGGMVVPYEYDTVVYPASASAVVYRWKSERTVELALGPTVAFVDMYVIGGISAAGFAEVQYVVGGASGFQCQLHVQQM